MSDRSCQDCEWEKLGMMCLQGHVRKMKGNLQERGHDPIKNCHAWKEKAKVVCWCEIDKNMEAWKYKNWNYCPKCGKKLGKEGI